MLRATGLHGGPKPRLVRVCRSLKLERLHDARRRRSPPDRARARLRPVVGRASSSSRGSAASSTASSATSRSSSSSPRCADGRSKAGRRHELLEPYGEWKGLASVYLLTGSGGAYSGAGRARSRGFRLSHVGSPAHRRRPDRGGPPRRLLSSGWRTPRDRRHRATQERVDELRERHGGEATLRPRGRGPGRCRRRRGQAAGLRRPARRDRASSSRRSRLVCRSRPRSRRRTIERHSPTASLWCARCRTRRRPCTRAWPASARARTPTTSTSRWPRSVLAHVGRVVRVPEEYLDAVTAVSGSGPAYFALLAEAMIEAGILLGLSREVSTQLVVQTMLGTASCCATRACTRSSCASRSRRRAERRSPPSASSSRPACAPPS